MSLRHALLAVLTAEPMTGYDLIKYFDGSVAFVWSAPHSQIYPELRRMLDDGLLDAEELPRGERATKTRYSINDAGLRELRRWAQDQQPLAAERDPHRLRAAYFEWGSYAAARAQLVRHRDHYRTYLRQWEAMVEGIEQRRVPLLQRRLEHTPAEEHEAVTQFKVFAFRGEVARAKAELRWAEEGLALLDRLEGAGTPLTGERLDGTPPSRVTRRRRGPRRAAR